MNGKFHPVDEGRRAVREVCRGGDGREGLRIIAQVSHLAVRAVLVAPEPTCVVECAGAQAPHAGVCRHLALREKGKATSTNPIASIFAWTRGLYYRSQFDGTPEVQALAQALETFCVETVEAGHMTKDLAILIDPDQTLLTTEQFLDKLDENLKKTLFAGVTANA